MKKKCALHTCGWVGLVCCAVGLAWLGSHAVGRYIESTRFAQLQDSMHKEIFDVQVETLSGRAMGAAILLGLTDELVKKVALGDMPSDNPQVLASLHIPRTEYGALTTFVMNTTGDIVAYETVRQKKSTGKNVAWRPYFQQAMKGIASVYAGVGFSSGERGVYFAAPVYAAASRKAKIIGVVALKMAASHVDQLLARFPGPALLLSPQGIVYATNRPDYIFRSKFPLAAKTLARVKEIRQFGNVFANKSPLPLPFQLNHSAVSLAGIAYAVYRAPIDWHDPHGTWELVVLSDKSGWFPWSWVWLLRGSIFLQIMLLGGFFYYRHRHRQQQARQAKAVAREQQRLLAITASIPGVVYQFKPGEDGGFTFVSPGVDELLGVSAAALRDDMAALFTNVDAADRARLEQEMHQPNKDLALWSDEFSLQQRGMARRWIFAKAICHYDEHDQPVWYGYLVDMTQRRQMEEELIVAKELADQASAAKGEFLASMSHEIRTPMNAIVGFSNLLLGTGLDALQRDFLAKLKSSAHLLLGIINDILDFSKIEAGKLQLEEIDFAISDIFEGLAGVIVVALADKKVELLFDVAGDVPPNLVGDPLRLSQVLLNLLSNSAKFTETGNIVVSVAVGPRSARDVQLNFSVRDTGIGLTEKQMKSIFADFSQGDLSTSRSYGGTGLGLAICKNLVALMGGEIGVVSGEGQGVEFWFTINFTIGPEQTLDVSGLVDKRVLVVDDNSVARDIFVRQLSALSCRVGTVSSGRKAIAVLNKTTPEQAYDLLILDWQMPGMNGLQVAEELLERFPREELPAMVMISAHGNDVVRDQAAQLGFAGYLTKPMTMAQLSAVLQTALRGQLLASLGEEKTAIKGGAGQRQMEKDLKGRTMLVVDDHDINRQVVRQLLEYSGMVAREAASGREAITCLEEDGDQIDAVLMDIQMPELDGLATTRIIRQRASWAKLPILGVSANILPADQQACLAAGMDDFIGKPIDMAEMLAKLHHLCCDRPAPK